LQFFGKENHIEPGSFRDREGRVFYSGNNVYRALSHEAFINWEALSKTRFYSKFIKQGYLIPTEQVDSWEEASPIPGRNWFGCLKHEKIPFISYPYEWPFGMLKDAALLQLELLQAALDENMVVKDASPFNIQWKGSQPVFIDIPSFEILRPSVPWLGYRQFCQLFLYPLFLQAYKNLPFQPWLRGRIDGITPKECNQYMSLRDLLRPGVMPHVFLQAKAQERYSSTKKNIKGELQDAGFNKSMIQVNAKSLYKIIKNLEWKQTKSEWSDYMSNHSYSTPDQKEKEKFVRTVIMSQSWGLVWDLGCNTGTFSRIASENSGFIVAMDSDPLVIERFYHSLKKDGIASILPLTMNFADTSPSCGWRGLERKSLFDRGTPDLVLCLALIHHLVISANIPLHEVIEVLAGLGTSLIIELKPCCVIN